MAIQNINVGTVANDGTGDDLRTAFGKLNSNFSTSENAASKLVATTPQAIAATAGVIPDAAGVKSYVDQFGLGKDSSVFITDADSLAFTGIYGTGATWTGSVYTGTSAANQGSVYHAQSHSTPLYATQLWMRMQNTKMYIRHKNNGVWSSWSQCYLNTDIIGTVSQSGGVPTGAIIETGSNANGTYTKYADGTMICNGAISITLTITTATGSLYVSTGAASITYPATFIATPKHLSVTQYAQTTVWVNVCNPLSTTAGQVFMMSSTSRASQGYAATFIAIGRWY